MTQNEELVDECTLNKLETSKDIGKQELPPSNLELQHPSDALLIYDWDDTILPTSWLRSQSMRSSSLS